MKFFRSLNGNEPLSEGAHSTPVAYCLQRARRRPVAGVSGAAKRARRVDSFQFVAVLNIKWKRMLERRVVPKYWRPEMVFHDVCGSSDVRDGKPCSVLPERAGISIGFLIVHLIKYSLWAM